MEYPVAAKLRDNAPHVFRTDRDDIPVISAPNEEIVLSGHAIEQHQNYPQG